MSMRDPLCKALRDVDLFPSPLPLPSSTDCRFTCHYRCRTHIQLDCSWDQGATLRSHSLVEHTIETDTNVVRIH